MILIIAETLTVYNEFTVCVYINITIINIIVLTSKKDPKTHLRKIPTLQYLER